MSIAGRARLSSVIRWDCGRKRGPGGRGSLRGRKLPAQRRHFPVALPEYPRLSNGDNELSPASDLLPPKFRLTERKTAAQERGQRLGRANVVRPGRRWRGPGNRRQDISSSKRRRALRWRGSRRKRPSASAGFIRRGEIQYIANRAVRFVDLTQVVACCQPGIYRFCVSPRRDFTTRRLRACANSVVVKLAGTLVPGDWLVYAPELSGTTTHG